MAAGYHYGVKLRITPTGLSPASAAASLAALPPGHSVPSARKSVRRHARVTSRLETAARGHLRRIPVRGRRLRLTSEYARGMPHAKVLESFWSLMKRGCTGICRKMSPKRLHRNVDEFPVSTTSAVTTSAHRWNGSERDGRKAAPYSGHDRTAWIGFWCTSLGRRFRGTVASVTKAGFGRYRYSWR